MTDGVKTFDQGDVVAFLCSPAAFGSEETVARVETHISLVFLCGDRVFKLKRAVKYPYLDFSTPEKRRTACEAEVAVNRRTAPDIYLGVRAVTRAADGTLAFDGAGEAVDWVVEMARFDDATLFDRLAEKGALTRHLMEGLADVIADFHLKADRVVRPDGHMSFAKTISGNAESFAAFGPGIVDMDKVAVLTPKLTAALEAATDILDSRAAGGFVRHCHGDMHLRNIFLGDDGAPVLFDAIEFNTLFAEIDVLYDVAFLWMDLDHRGLGRLASLTMNRYLDATGDGGDLAVLPLLMALRAAIRAHVSATSAAQHSDARAAAGLKADAQDYLDRALAYLDPTPPRLIATGGLSGSGKSRMARELAPLVGAAPGARVVRSDAIRKRLAGVPLLTRLGPDGYTKDMNARTYETLYAEARAALAAGRTVVADAVFARPDERAKIEAIADEMGVPFTGLWLEADPAVMVERAETRTANVSDAGADVVKRQLGYDLGDITWARIDSSGAREDTTAKGRVAVGV